MLVLYLLCTSVNHFLLNSFVCCYGYWFTDEYSVITNINKPYNTIITNNNSNINLLLYLFYIIITIIC